MDSFDDGLSYSRRLPVEVAIAFVTPPWLSAGGRQPGPEYSDADAPITVKLHTSTADGTLAIDILDRGIGMKAEDLARATQTFVRLGEAEGKGEAGGVGVGFYSARSFIEAHGGRLELRSRLGEGTLARIMFSAHRVGR